MNFVAIKYLNRSGPRTLSIITRYLLRRNSSTNDPCNQQGPCAPPPKPKEPCSPPPTPTSTCPEPPPCPPMPPCPPSICPPAADPGDPCNYCPPPCIDPDYPNITHLKKKQCQHQKNMDVPVYVIEGTRDVILFQAIIFLTFLSFAVSINSVIKLCN